MEDLVENKIRKLPSKFIIKITDNNTNMNEYTASNPNTSWEIKYEYKGDGI